jgi:hypothetical protein
MKKSSFRFVLIFVISLVSAISNLPTIYLKK